MVDGAACHHEAGVEGSSCNSAEGMPCSVVKPVPELVKAICHEILGSSEVEPGIDWKRGRGVSDDVFVSGGSLGEKATYIRG